MDSPIFDADMFGRAMGSAENSYQLTEGRFGNIANILDADHTLADIDGNHNAYGYLSPLFNYQVGKWCGRFFSRKSCVDLNTVGA